MSESAAALGPGTERDYVGFRRRLLAAFIDNATWLLFFAWFFSDLVVTIADESAEAAGIVSVVLLSLWFNYFSFCEWRWGQTIGKNATGIMVTTVDGGEISFGQASMRNLLRLVDFFVIGWLMIAADSRKQRLGDKVAKTVVIRRPPRKAPAAAAGAAAALASPSGRRPAPPPPAPEFAHSPYVASASGAPSPPPPSPRPPSLPPPPSAATTVAATAPGAALRGSLPAIPWSPADTGWGLVAGLLLGFMLAPALVLPFDPGLDSAAGLLAAQALLGVTLVAVALGAASSWRFRALRETLSRLGLRRFAPSALGWMLAAMFAYYVAAAIFSVFVVTPDQEDIGGELGVGDENLVVAVMAVVLIAGLAPISEELFFRGFLFSGLRVRFSLWPAALIAGLVFGAIHAPTGVTTVIPLTALGVALCWLYEKTGSLWPCVLIHLFNNGLALVLIS